MITREEAKLFCNPDDVTLLIYIAAAANDWVEATESPGYSLDDPTTPGGATKLALQAWRDKQSQDKPVNTRLYGECEIEKRNAIDKDREF